MKFTGGIRFGESYLGSVNASWPFAKLEVEKGFLALSALGKSFEFGETGSVWISKYRGIFSKGLRFEPADRSHPRFLVFWTFNQSAVIASLAEAGFKVAERSQASEAQTSA